MHFCTKFTVGVYVQSSFFPLAGLESFCDSKMVYNPLFTDQSSSIVSPALPPPLLLTLVPALPFTDLKSVEDTLKATVGLRSGSDESVTSLFLSATKDVLKALKFGNPSGPSLVEIACRVESQSSSDNGSLVEKDLIELTIAVCSALSCLKECKLTSRTYMVKQLHV